MTCGSQYFQSVLKAPRKAEEKARMLARILILDRKSETVAL